jgi:hypothetical protein
MGNEESSTWNIEPISYHMMHASSNKVPISVWVLWSFRTFWCDEWRNFWDSSCSCVYFFITRKWLLSIVSSVSAGMPVSLCIYPLLFRILKRFEIVAAKICNDKMVLKKALVLGLVLYSILMMISGSDFCFLRERVSWIDLLLTINH